MKVLHFLTLSSVGILCASGTPTATKLTMRDENIRITTWSGNNCEGSSANPSITGSGHACFNNLPGASFNVPNGNNHCKITTWSGTNCEGSSAVFAGDIQGCIAIPFGSVSLDCWEVAGKIGGYNAPLTRYSPSRHLGRFTHYIYVRLFEGKHSRFKCI